MGTWTPWNHLGRSRPVTGLLYLFCSIKIESFDTIPTLIPLKGWPINILACSWDFKLFYNLYACPEGSVGNRVHLSLTIREVLSVSLRIRWPRIMCKHVQEKLHDLRMDGKKKRLHPSTVKQQLVGESVLFMILNVSYSYKFVSTQNSIWTRISKYRNKPDDVLHHEHTVCKLILVFFIKCIICCSFIFSLHVSYNSFCQYQEFQAII
jgi:hypothetical protein